MTPEQQRLAIAEARGYHTNHNSMMCRARGLEIRNQSFWHPIPDYPNDLNAMHEVEKGLTETEKCVYANYLGMLVDIYDDWYKGITYTEASKLIYATASQRSEAWLRTKGLWKD